ncbi:MAG: aminoacyl-tRNA hydrolase [Pseudomonadota bacterium]
MKLIVGLGNPGAKYAQHRHNIGFMALDQISKDHGFSTWKNKHQGRISEGRFGSARAVLLKPETFMNNSGQSVQAAMRFFKLNPSDVVVLHDEIDLAPGKVKHKVGGGHAGHNGLRSIDAHIGPEYTRVRLGVGHPGRKELVPAYVLHDFGKADQDWLDDVLRGVSDGAPFLTSEEPAKFSNAVALRTAPPRSSTGQKSDAQKASEASKKPEQKAVGNSPVAESKSALQRLVERFR